MSTHSQLLREIEQIAITAISAEKLMQEICDRIHTAMARYNWVGFYLPDKNEAQMLVVGPYTGSFVPHQRIPFGQGMCGAVAIGGRTLGANDLAGEHISLAVSEKRKS